MSGKKKDLSSFGVDFLDNVQVKIKALKGKAIIFINNRLAYRVDQEIRKTKIIGIDFVFQGTGTVNYVKLTNDKITFEDRFTEN